ncbi:MAG: cbb3-type cytochrome c oxidase subunit I [Proteobacteria bacterium]|nr:cbb3-type cytochrome c oxidase subunit I [Pseudomonadota bacterium]
MQKEDILSLPPQDKISRVLINVLIFVVIGCWATMIWATYRTYLGAPPIPEQFISASGQVILTKDDIVAGKGGFQKAGLMDYGSLYGMGSYFGEDYTAHYLVALGKGVSFNIAKDKYAKTILSLSPEQSDMVQKETQSQLKAIALTDAPVVLPGPLCNAIVTLRQDIAKKLLQNDFVRGWAKASSLSSVEALQTADFLIYSAITTVANRPGENYSWTNNWPFEPSLGNTPTTSVFIWTWASLTLLFFAIGVVVAVFRLYIERKEPHETTQGFLNTFSPLTPSQLALGKYFILVALLLLVQIGAGSLLAHYYAERESFYGFDIGYYFPFSFLRSVHLQTPIVWIGLGWIGSALFLAPLIGKNEPKGQQALVHILFWTLVIIVCGAFLGNYLGIQGIIQKGWFWFGNQGLSYIELGRFWQILFFFGLLIWSLVLLRAMWPTLVNLVYWRSFYSFFRAEHLLWYSTMGVAFVYAFGMIPLTKVGSSFTLTDFWRWWVVHLWVEWAFELFAAAITGYFLMAVGLVSRQLAERAILLEWVLILGSGILGTGHHLFWAGAPNIWISLGSMFSFLEILPLFLLILEAIEHYFLIRNRDNFPYRLPFLYILGAAFWNFVGAGVFGGAINAPLVNYYEHGTFLTLNHAHTAMFGAFGLLSLGLIYLTLRYMAGNRTQWDDRLGMWAFWLYNAGLLLWIIFNFFPIGWPQLMAVYDHGYNYARSLEFYNTTLLWQWMRMPGDIIFAVAALLMAWDFMRKTRFFKSSLKEAGVRLKEGL